MENGRQGGHGDAEPTGHEKMPGTRRGRAVVEQLGAPYVSRRPMADHMAAGWRRAG